MRDAARQPAYSFNLTTMVKFLFLEAQFFFSLLAARDVTLLLWQTLGGRPFLSKSAVTITYWPKTVVRLYASASLRLPRAFLPILAFFKIL